MEVNRNPKEELLDQKQKELIALQNELNRLKYAFEDKVEPDHTLIANRSGINMNGTDQDIAEEYIARIGYEIFCDLRDLFESYASLADINTWTIMSLTQFLKLFTDLDLLTTNNSRKALELLFCRNNTTHTVTLWQFFDLITNIARERFPRESDKIALLEKYSLQFLLPAANVSDNRILQTMWKNEIAEPEVQAFLASKHERLNFIFSKYRSEFFSNSVITLDKAAVFAKDFALTPDMISKPDLGRLFRSVQDSVLHTPQIRFEQWVNLICFIGISCGLKVQSTTILDYVEEIVEKLEKESEVLKPRAKKRTHK